MQAGTKQAASSTVPLAVVQFGALTYLGIFAEVSGDLFQGFARNYRDGSLHVALREFPLFIFGVLVFVCILLLSVAFQDKVLKLGEPALGTWQRRVTLTAAFITTAVIKGYFS